MQKVTPTEFRSNTSQVFNEVQANGKIKIVSRGRPDMILMTAKELERIITGKESEFIIEK